MNIAEERDFKRGKLLEKYMTKMEVSFSGEETLKKGEGIMLELKTVNLIFLFSFFISYFILDLGLELA